MAQVLVIDDMNGVRQTVSAVLERAGHMVTQARDGGAGLQLLKSGQHFDVVITDMIMPEHDGMEVIMYLENRPDRPKMLAMSGGGSQVSADDRFMLARTKADATLQKPFRRAHLLDTVDKLLAVEPAVSQPARRPTVAPTEKAGPPSIRNGRDGQPDQFLTVGRPQLVQSAMSSLALKQLALG